MINKKYIKILFILLIILFFTYYLSRINVSLRNPDIKDDGSNGGNVPLIYYNIERRIENEKI